MSCHVLSWTVMSLKVYFQSNFMMFSSSRRIITQGILRGDAQPISLIHLHGKVEWLECMHSFIQQILIKQVPGTEPDVADMTISKRNTFPYHLSRHTQLSLHCPVVWNLSKNEHKVNSICIQLSIISKEGSQCLPYRNQNVSTKRKIADHLFVRRGDETGSESLKVSHGYLSGKVKTWTQTLPFICSFCATPQGLLLPHPHHPCLLQRETKSNFWMMATQITSRCS